MKARKSRINRSLHSILVELRSDGKGWILLTIAVGWFFSIGVRYIYPSLLPLIRTEFGFDLTIAGLLLSSLWFAYALGQFPSGILGDRIGEGNILVISTAVSAAAVLIVTTSVNVLALFLGTVAFGFATSLYGPTRFTVFTDIYGDRAGTAVGLSHAAGSIGNTILPALAVIIASFTTWRFGYGFLVPAFVGCTLALWLVVPKRTSTNDLPLHRGSKQKIRRILASITRRGIPIIVSIQILIGFVSQGFLGFYPTYIVEVKEFSPQVAALLFGAYFAFGILIQPLTGVCKDRFGSRLTLGVLIGLFFLGLLWLYFAQTLVDLLFVTVLLSHRGGTGIVSNTFVADALFDDIKGSGLGFLRTSWMLIGATAPIFVGYFGDLGFLRDIFLVLAAITGIAMVLTAFVPEL